MNRGRVDADWIKRQLVSSYPSVAGVFLEKLPELIEENVSRGFTLKHKHSSDELTWKQYNEVFQTQCELRGDIEAGRSSLLSLTPTNINETSSRYDETTVP